MREKRFESRFELTRKLLVIEARDGAILGQTKNLGTGGMLLFGGKELPAGKELHIRICPDESTSEPIEVKAVCRWSAEHENPGFFYTGLEFSGVSAESKQQLRDLLHSYGLCDDSSLR